MMESKMSCALFVPWSLIWNWKLLFLRHNAMQLTDVSYSGISLKTQELYAIVFLARYLDLFSDFISVYNTVMKLVFIGSSLAIVWCVRFHRVVRRSYDRELDTFRHYFLVGGCLLLALFVHEKFSFREVSLISIMGLFWFYLKGVRGLVTSMMFTVRRLRSFI